ncbi:MAG: hypothetical protein ACFB21_09625 [Opitutales bacterium]
MTTTRISSAPQFVLSGACSADLQGDTITFRIERLENIATDPLEPALQLWACPEAPGNESATGVRLAEITLPPLEPGHTEERLSRQALVEATLKGSYHLVLAVAKGAGSDQWEDQRVLSEDFTFEHPTLIDPVSFEVGLRGTEVVLAGYMNPRVEDNVSGSLSLELWALPEPFRDGAPEGHCIGQLLQGTLPGQEKRTDLRLRYLPAELGGGAHYLALLLREWNGKTYLTRDYRNTSEALSWPIETQVTIGPSEPLAVAPLAPVTMPAPDEIDPPRDEAYSSAPPEAVEPIIAPSDASSIAAEADSLQSEMAAAEVSEGEPTEKISFWKRFQRLFGKK